MTRRLVINNFEINNQKNKISNNLILLIDSLFVKFVSISVNSPATAESSGDGWLILPMLSTQDWNLALPIYIISFYSKDQ